MTHTNAVERRIEQLRDASLDDARLHELIELMLSGAIRRQLWLLFLDRDDRMSEAVMPTDDFPGAPDEPVVAGDLGPTTAAQLLAARLPLMCEAIGASQVALVWEREGDDRFRNDELAWAAAIAGALQDSEVRLRAQFVLHDDGLRALTPDDYARAG
ncbi:hypothetical protein [Microbacterium sp. JZ31]|uniref:hypothetical protein n=1 Tax=Microbacterium sp. JZ31 TaxID=1906274 RepID=UPI00193257E2|nr:hypothetical protein [Microbacterium sp. JZ31]